VLRRDFGSRVDSFNRDNRNRFYTACVYSDKSPDYAANCRATDHCTAQITVFIGRTSNYIAAA